jgi:phosphate-selective porin OprO/OprP
MTARFVWAPLHKRRRVLHLAAGFERRDLDGGAISRVRIRPELGLNGENLVNTGSLTGVDGYTSFNLEAAYMRKSFLVKANYIQRRNDAPGLGNPTFRGGSIEAAYVLTGERQRYGLANGTFGAVRPRSKAGAVELAARYSFVDLNDGTVRGGRQENWSIGVNWYQTRNTRLMVNYVNARSTPGSNGQRENVSALMARFQIAF